MMLIFPAQESGFASWIPTYSIKAGLADTEGAAIYSLYFWVPNSIARIVWASLTRFTVTKRCKFIETTITLTSFLLVILQFFEMYSFVCLIGPLIFGSMVACFYPFCMALPLDNGFQNTVSNNANFVLANCIGEGLLNGSLGYAMRIFGFDSLMIIVMLSCVVSYWSFEKMAQSFQDDKVVEGQEMSFINSD